MFVFSSHVVETSNSLTRLVGSPFFRCVSERLATQAMEGTNGFLKFKALQNKCRQAHSIFSPWVIAKNCFGGTSS
jgi:hypothetical protein